MHSETIKARLFWNLEAVCDPKGFQLQMAPVMILGSLWAVGFFFRYLNGFNHEC